MTAERIPVDHLVVGALHALEGEENRGHIRLRLGDSALLLGADDRRNDQPGQNRDDADHHEEFDEGEGLFLFHFSIPLLRIDCISFGESVSSHVIVNADW